MRSSKTTPTLDAPADAVADKRAIVAQIRLNLVDAQRVMMDAATAAKDAATHEENKPENDKDTRAIEAGYLAGSQAQRHRDITLALAALDHMPVRAFLPDEPVAVGALVTLERGRITSKAFVIALGGGSKVALAGADVHVITPSSPLGEALMGTCQGDSAEIVGRNVEIVRVLAVR